MAGGLVEVSRDLAGLVVSDVGRLVETGDPWEPYRLLDASGGLRTSLAAAQDKLAHLGDRARRASTINLGIPAYRDIAGRTATVLKDHPMTPPDRMATALRNRADGLYCLVRPPNCS